MKRNWLLSSSPSTGGPPANITSRKKKLHNSAKKKAILQELSPVPLESLEKISDPDAALCSKCEKEMKRIIYLRRELQSLKQRVTDKLISISNRGSSDTPNPKRVCVSPQPGSSSQHSSASPVSATEESPPQVQVY